MVVLLLLLANDPIIPMPPIKNALPFLDKAASKHHSNCLQTWDKQGFTIGINNVLVGSGKTVLVLALIKRLVVKTALDYPPLVVATINISAQEDA
jgi:hypothetical protein